MWLYSVEICPWLMVRWIVNKEKANLQISGSDYIPTLMSGYEIWILDINSFLCSATGLNIRDRVWMSLKWSHCSSSHWRQLKWFEHQDASQALLHERFPSTSRARPRGRPRSDRRERMFFLVWECFGVWWMSRRVTGERDDCRSLLQQLLQSFTLWN